MKYNLQGITQEQALELLCEQFKDDVYPELQYYSWPQMFPNTAGPFSKPGMISGQAFTEFQMECWTDGMYTLIFCNGKVVKMYKGEEPFSVNGYLGMRRF